MCIRDSTGRYFSRKAAIFSVFVKYLSISQETFIPVCSSDFYRYSSIYTTCLLYTSRKIYHGYFQPWFIQTNWFKRPRWWRCSWSVSYTHLDVYKRQTQDCTENEGICKADSIRFQHSFFITGTPVLTDKACTCSIKRKQDVYKRQVKIHHTFCCRLLVLWWKQL